MKHKKRKRTLPTLLVIDQQFDFAPIPKEGLEIGKANKDANRMIELISSMGHFTTHFVRTDFLRSSPWFTAS